MFERGDCSVADIDFVGENLNGGGLVNEGDVFVGVFGGDVDVEF